jgi:hypothetical protein
VITPLEREDIQALAAALYKIPKTVEKIGERVLMWPGNMRGSNFENDLQLLDQSAETVLAMVKDLRKGTGRGDGAGAERAIAEHRRRCG